MNTYLYENVRDYNVKLTLTFHLATCCMFIKCLNKSWLRCSNLNNICVIVSILEGFTISNNLWLETHTVVVPFTLGDINCLICSVPEICLPLLQNSPSTTHTTKHYRLTRMFLMTTYVLLHFTFKAIICQPGFMLEAFSLSCWSNCKNNRSFLCLLLKKIFKSIAEGEHFWFWLWR